jgi:GTPase Era involved in 16S rRNA processing
MSATAPFTIKQRLQRLESHLRQENPILLDVVKSFRTLDRVAQRLGLLTNNESYATQVPWWPLVSILGTFSSGKSTFINDYIGFKLQLTGNQAVDDKFTVVCYSSDETARTLPGLALDADPRFPFYHISQDIEAVAGGEGRRVDAYMQLKTCPTDRLRGKILIDSPGFDADSQRTSTLRITKQIVDLSDLVLVFFDARHPEPGAMQDTLEHLVVQTIQRPDSTKFLYILNQIDTTAREDNPEDVFAAWQRAVAGKGLTAGRFYRIYNLEAAIDIPDENLRARFESKRASDMAEIMERMKQVEVERAYRIIGVLEKTAKDIATDLVPQIASAKQAWKKHVLWMDGIIFGALAVGGLTLSFIFGWWQGPQFAPPWLDWFASKPWWYNAIVGGVIFFEVFLIHAGVRRFAARLVQRGLERDDAPRPVVQAFQKNTKLTHGVLWTKPAGWRRGTRKLIEKVLSDADGYVQALNDRFINPSGQAPQTKSARAVQPAAAAPEPNTTPTTESPSQPGKEAAETTAPPTAEQQQPGQQDQTPQVPPYIRFDISQLDWISEGIRPERSPAETRRTSPTSEENTASAGKNKD